MRPNRYFLIIILACCLILISCGGNVPPQTEATSPESDFTENATENETPETTESTEPETTTPETTVPETASPEFIEEVRPTVEAALDEYARFFIYQGFDLASYVDTDSDLYGYLFGSDTYNRIYNEYYNYEYVDSYWYSLFETSDYSLQGDDRFTVNVRYKLDIQFSRDDCEDENQKADATWTFRNTADGWKLCDITNNNITSLTDIQATDIMISNIRGKDYDGVVMIVDDATRLFVGTVPFFAYDYGETVPEMINDYRYMGYAIDGGINGGNFDDGGTGSSYTAMPKGIVISEGDVLFDEYLDTANEDGSTIYHLTGFTGDGRFIIGNYTANEAIDLGVTDAVYTTEEDGPFLIMDGQIQYDQLPSPYIYGAGKNPRTAIGQRADGSVILLVINGRQPSSLGASFEDLANIMLELGAVNASAMDGGTSSQMIWQDEILNQPFSAFGLRMCPTAWLIRG